MRLNNITVEDLGVLQNVQLDDLSALNVVYDGNGTGKSTLVKFLRQTLLSATVARDPNQSDAVLGSVTVSAGANRWDIIRCESSSSGYQTSVRHRDNPDWDGSLRARFPDWITDEVFEEIFCPGSAEADRFELLTQLCLETAGDFNDDEIVQTERAIRLAVQERDGTKTEGGIVRQISDLELQRDTLERDLSRLRRPEQKLLGEIARIQDRLDVPQRSNEEIDQESSPSLEHLTEIDDRLNVQQRNTLQLDAETIRTKLSEVTDRRHRWAQHQAILQNEVRHYKNSETGSSHRLTDPIRALINRIEQRLQERPHDWEQWKHQLSNEITSLCNAVVSHRNTAAQLESSLEAQITFETLDCARRMETLLQSRIDALREDLARATNLPDLEFDQPPAGCCGTWPNDLRLADSAGGEHRNRLQRERTSHSDRLNELLTKHSGGAEEVSFLKAELERLQQRQGDSASLEQIDHLKAQLAEVDACLQLLISRRDELTQTEASLRQVAVRLRDRPQPAALEIASSLIRQLTCDECTQILAESTHTRLLVRTTRQRTPCEIRQLSRDTRHQVSLALRLALLQTHGHNSERMPLIIDDVFITFDDERGAAAADQLRRVASEGQQIMLLTCQDEVQALLAARGARVYSLLSSPVHVPAGDPVTETADPASSVSEQIRIKVSDDTESKVAADQSPGAIGDSIPEDESSHWLFYLETDDPIGQLSGAAAGELTSLRAVRVESIDDLVSAPLSQLQNQIRDGGGGINDDRLRDLQAQGRMSVCIPLLRQHDAELLVAAGIDNFRRLARLRPEAVYELVIRFQTSEIGRTFLHSGHTIDRQQAINWNRWALHARTIERARQETAQRRSRRLLTEPSGSAKSSGILSRRHREGRSTESVRISVRSRLSEERRRQREHRTSERRKHRDRDVSKHPHLSGRHAGTGAQFYLSRTSSMEEAPSIGPKTASRLARVNITTVNALLECNPETIATLLDHRRITPNVIRVWQSQAHLVCTIPQLRGHDAQILVACGLKDVKAVCEKSPESLYAIVRPFCDSKEGLRIIRGGRKPDLRDVSDWISWAGRSRSLKAA